MVSNASEDFPDPDTPVTTVSALCRISKSMFLRLWTRAPRTRMLSLEVNVDITSGLAGFAPEALFTTDGRQTPPEALPNLSIIKQGISGTRRMRHGTLRARQ